MASHFDPTLISDKEGDKIKQRIEDKSYLNEETGCIEWLKSKNSAHYPQMKLGKEFNDRFKEKPYNPAHLLYSMHYNIVLNVDKYQISHRCHNKNCLNKFHLSYEPGFVNNLRDKCRVLSVCSTHGQWPVCLF